MGPVVGTVWADRMLHELGGFLLVLHALLTDNLILPLIPACWLR